MGIERGFEIDLVNLEKRYKSLTKILHPDRFARAGAEARRASLERTVQLNDAWRTLSDPVSRAEYLLALHGIYLGEHGRPVPGKTMDSPPTTQPTSQSLLMEIMELQENLAAAKMAKEPAKIAALQDAVTKRLEEVMSSIANEFSQPNPRYAVLADYLMTVRYYRRFLEEAQTQQQAVATTSKELHRAS
jgi:molecular chaperone HscB